MRCASGDDCASVPSQASRPPSCVQTNGYRDHSTTKGSQAAKGAVLLLSLHSSPISHCLALSKPFLFAANPSFTSCFH